MSDVMKARLTEMNVAGRYMRVTIVTARTVALSSTVSFVKVTRWPLDSAVISWFCRFSPSASCHGVSLSVPHDFAIFDDVYSQISSCFLCELVVHGSFQGSSQVDIRMP